jgi:pre-mRNA-splicing factor ISY1
LTDYEVRDVNDEINKLMREKRHWENQIIALGGANYRRNVAMLDDDGKEVPGTKGYKYVRSNSIPTIEVVADKMLGILAAQKTSQAYENFSRAKSKRKKKNIKRSHSIKSL